ncbi:MAG: hypothetical protein ACOVOG_12275 [Rubrivivax sp.]|jgi:hypothetical protein|nr:hypothetical protein [Rubrivivax sp.]
MARVIDSNLWAAPDHAGEDAVEATSSDRPIASDQPATAQPCLPTATLPDGLTEEQLSALSERFGPLDTSRLPLKPPQA